MASPPPQAPPASPPAPASSTTDSLKALSVGNLDPLVTEDSLRDFFSAVGPVTHARIVSQDRNYRNPVNYGYVEFRDREAAERALATVQGHKLYNHEIQLSWAPQNSQSPRNETVSKAVFKVFVGDIGPEIGDEALAKVFGPFGLVTEARVMWDAATGNSRGYGFVAFKSRMDAERAIAAMNGQNLGGERPLRVNWANPRSVTDPGSPAWAARNMGVVPAGPPMHMPRGGYVGHAGGHGGHPRGGFGGHGAPNHHHGPPHHGFGPGGAHGFPGRPRGPFVRYTFQEVLAQAPYYNTTVYIGNIPPNFTAHDLIPIFQQFGYIIEVKTQADRGFGFVKFDTHENAASAIVRIHGSIVHGKQVRCSWGKERPPEIDPNAPAPAPVGAWAPQGFPMVYGGYPGFAPYGMGPDQAQAQAAAEAGGVWYGYMPAGPVEGQEGAWVLAGNGEVAGPEGAVPMFVPITDAEYGGVGQAWYPYMHVAAPPFDMAGASSPPALPPHPLIEGSPPPAVPVLVVGRPELPATRPSAGPAAMVRGGD